MKKKLFKNSGLLDYMLKNCRPQPVTLPLQFRIILPNIVQVLKSRSASATIIKDVLLVCMVLNGEGGQLVVVYMGNVLFPLTY